MKDAELFALNALVQDGLSAGQSPAKALESLQQFLKESVIRSEDLEFSTVTSTEPLLRHLLLCHSSTLGIQLSKVYPAISGSGAHYNGMFGNGEATRDCDVMHTLAKVSAPPVSIAEQVVLCVRVLGTSVESLMPEVSSAVRRQLSDILLKYPVLMHPNILIPVMRGDGCEYNSVASALSTSMHGALPSYCHFHSAPAESEVAANSVLPDVDQALVARLTAFAKHPCVRLAFGRAAYRVRQDTTGTSTRKRGMKTSHEMLVRSMLGLTGPRHEFLASVMELEELANPASGAVRPFWERVKGEKHLLPQLDAMLANSVYAACGVVHTVAMQDTFPQSMRRYRADSAFLQGIQARAEHIFGAKPRESTAGRQLSTSATRRIFLSHQDDVPAAELAYNVHNMAHGLVLCGFTKTIREAAEFLLDVTLGPKRESDRLPRADVIGAMAFLKAVAELGGLGGTAEELVESLNRLKESVETMPLYSVRFRDAWIKACEVFATEHLMLSVIRSASAEADNGPALEHAVPTTPTFVPVRLPDAAAPTGEIRIEVRRASTTITVAWPMAAATECATWIRELLR